MLGYNYRVANIVRVNETVRLVIRQAREKILPNCASILEEARKFFEQTRFPRACFLAMTAIEEAGKLTVLRFIAHDTAEKFGFCPSEVNLGALDAFLRDHPEKAREAVAQSLYINAGTDRRHGVHPTSGMHRTSGLILIIRAGGWMKLRNSCLYVDVKFEPPEAASPDERVSQALSYYMITMGYEVVVEQAPAALDVPSPGWIEFQDGMIDQLREFMSRWGASSNIDDLDFLANPEPWQREAERREK